MMFVLILVPNLWEVAFGLSGIISTVFVRVISLAPEQKGKYSITYRTLSKESKN